MPLLSIQRSWDSSETDCRTVASEWVASISETNRHTTYSLTASKAKRWKHRSESGASALLSVQMASHPAECRGVMHHCQSLSVRLCGVGVSGVRLDEAGCVTTCKLQGPRCPLPAVSTRAAQRRDGGRTRGRPPASILLAGLMGVCVPASHAEVCRLFFSKFCSRRRRSVQSLACPERQSQVGRSRSSTGLALCRGLASSPSDLSVPCSSASPLDAG